MEEVAIKAAAHVELIEAIRKFYMENKPKNPNGYSVEEARVLNNSLMDSIIEGINKANEILRSERDGYASRLMAMTKDRDGLVLKLSNKTSELVDAEKDRDYYHTQLKCVKSFLQDIKRSRTDITEILNGI